MTQAPPPGRQRSRRAHHRRCQRHRPHSLRALHGPRRRRPVPGLPVPAHGDASLAQRRRAHRDRLRPHRQRPGLGRLGAGRRWHHAALVAQPRRRPGRPDEAVTWSTTEPATIDTDGLLQWTPSRDDVGSQQLEMTASASTSADRRIIDVEVQCEPLKLTIGCSTTDGLWLLAALAWVRRRQLSGREGTRTPTPCGTRF